MTSVDTGYLVALLDPDDQLHERAMRWAFRLTGPLLVTEYVLLEVVDSFSRPRDRPKADAAATLIRTHPQYRFLPASVALLDAGLDLHLAVRTKSGP